MEPATTQLAPLETRRQIEHIVPVAFCILLGFLDYAWILVLGAIAIVYGVIGSRLLVKGTQRPDEEARGYSIGKIAYAVSVFVLLLLFPEHLYIVAGAWCCMAAGDAASNLAGRRLAGAAIPWNRRYTVAGSIAFVFASVPIALGAMIYVSALRGTETLGFGAAFWLALFAAVAGALAETIPWRIDDNFSVPFISAGTLFLVSHALGVL